MLTLISDPSISVRLIAERRDRGVDALDEVWEGVYQMAPAPNNEHQELVFEIGFVLREVVVTAGMGKVLPGANVAGFAPDWTQDYRCPDLAVFLNSSGASNRGSHWFGGPDFVVEVVSPLDRSREKLAFYERVGAKEVLLVERDPWSLEIFHNDRGQLSSRGVASPNQGSVVSPGLGLEWKLSAGADRPRIQILHGASGRRWTV